MKTIKKIGLGGGIIALLLSGVSLFGATSNTEIVWDKPTTDVSWAEDVKKENFNIKSTAVLNTMIASLTTKLEREDLYEKTATSISEGKIIGWFQGRSEIGPRALGNRSILADPRRPDMRDHINFKVKHREWFRPLAPSAILDRADEFFDLRAESPFMIVVCNVKPDKRALIPAVTHIDGTARIQTVTREENEKYYDVIKKFGELTGVPLLLNTSFNDAGKPIVETPEDAIAAFLGMNLDYLVIGDYFINKKSALI